MFWGLNRDPKRLRGEVTVPLPVNLSRPLRGLLRMVLSAYGGQESDCISPPVGDIHGEGYRHLLHASSPHDG